MNHPDTILLYVKKTAVSAAFYHRLFSAPIVEESENFALLILSNGVKLGLWAESDVKPAPDLGVSGFELCVQVGTDLLTEAAWAEVQAASLPVLQKPTRLDFGLTFVVSSPDGHRIRVFSAPLR